MRIKFYGVRGSIPTPDPDCMIFGGNTACIRIEAKPEHIIILDAGTGIRQLGVDILKESGGKPISADIFITHTHWDHIQGMPFFAPAFIPGSQIRFYGPLNYERSLEDALAGQMLRTYFPVRLADMSADISFLELGEGSIEISGMKVMVHYLNHPIMTVGYRFEYAGRILATLFDTEPYRNHFENELVDEKIKAQGQLVADEKTERMIDFIRGANTLIMDAQYTEKEYEKKHGWGHSTPKYALEAAKKASVERLVLFHHEPMHNDKFLENMESELKKEADGSGIEVIAAREGMILGI